MGLIYCSRLISIRRWVLSVVLIEKGVPLGVLPDSPVGLGCVIKTVSVMSAGARSATITLIEPRLFMAGNILLVEVPKNLGPSE
jgi:hypothetical protein